MAFAMAHPETELACRPAGTLETITALTSE
jgi:hypothetical protein